MSFFTNTGLRRSIRNATPDSSVTTTSFLDDHHATIGTGVSYSYTITFPRRSTRIASMPRVDYSTRAFERIVEDIAETKFNRKYGATHVHTHVETKPYQHHVVEIQPTCVTHDYNLRPRSTMSVTQQQTPRRSARLAMKHTA